LLTLRQPPRPTLLPYTTLFRSVLASAPGNALELERHFPDFRRFLVHLEEIAQRLFHLIGFFQGHADFEGNHLRQSISQAIGLALDRKSTRLNSSHVKISYAVFC